MIGFIYKTTCLVNGKIYIGQHEGNIGDDYIGSGTIFKRAVIKYGKENFKREILRECNTHHELRIWEYFYIKKYKSQDIRIGYNVADGDVNTKEYNPVKSLEVRKKISETLKRKYANGEIDKSKIIRTGVNHPMYGKHHSEESKRKNSESRKRYAATHKHPLQGTHCSEETKRKISEGNKKYAREHIEIYRKKIKDYLLTHNPPMLGKHHSEEAKRKMSIKALMRNKWFWITNGVKNKRCEYNKAIPDGWRKGITASKRTKKKSITWLLKK